jgi:hypothetical protein
MENLWSKLTSDQTLRAIDALNKLFVGLVASSYLLGLLIVNLYFSQYGFYSLSLFRLNYVIAGLWAIASVFLSYFLLELILIALALVLTRTIPLRERISTALAYIGGAFLFTYAVYVVVAVFGVLMTWNWLLYSSVGAMSILGVKRNLRDFLPRYDDLKFKASAAAGTAVAVLFFVLFVLGFAKDLYGRIPASSGGGESQLVQIVLKPEYQKQFQSLGLFRSNDTIPSYSCMSDTLALLLSADVDLVFLLPHKGNRSVQLQREMVSAIVYYKRQGPHF